VTTSQPGSAEPALSRGPKIVAVDQAAASQKPAQQRSSQRFSYTSWDFMCAQARLSNASEVLNNAGRNGWELTGFGQLGHAEMLCFKRPQATARRVPR
jgi:hypothetical protein